MFVTRSSSSHTMYPLKVNKNSNGQRQGHQAQSVSGVIDDGRQFNDWLEVEDACGVGDVRTSIIVGVVVPGAVVVAKTCCIICSEKMETKGNGKSKESSSYLCYFRLT